MPQILPRENRCTLPQGQPSWMKTSFDFLFTTLFSWVTPREPLVLWVPGVLGHRYGSRIWGQRNRTVGKVLTLHS